MMGLGCGVTGVFGGVVIYTGLLLMVRGWRILCSAKHKHRM